MELYRYKAQRYSVVIDADREQYGVSDPQLCLETYLVEKETPCGYWINCWGCLSGKRWVSKTTTKRFAHSTKEGALQAFLRRKKAHVKHAAAALRGAEQELRLAEQALARGVI